VPKARGEQRRGVRPPQQNEGESRGIKTRPRFPRNHRQKNKKSGGSRDQKDGPLLKFSAPTNLPPERRNPQGLWALTSTKVGQGPGGKLIERVGGEKKRGVLKPPLR